MLPKDTLMMLNSESFTSSWLPVDDAAKTTSRRRVVATPSWTCGAPGAASTSPHGAMQRAYAVRSGARAPQAVRPERARGDATQGRDAALQRASILWQVLLTRCCGLEKTRRVDGRRVFDRVCSTTYERLSCVSAPTHSARPICACDTQ